MLAREERLGIGDEAEMLVSVLAARDTQMPLAVGLFGDWGSGKSFLMSLMEERVNALVADSLKGDSDWPSRVQVRQVRFNAWHFVDQDLWACLASTMSDQLARPETDADGAEALRKQIAEIKEAEEQLDSARSRLAEAGSSRLCR